MIPPTPKHLDPAMRVTVINPSPSKAFHNLISEQQALIAEMAETMGISYEQLVGAKAEQRTEAPHQNEGDDHVRR